MAGRREAIAATRPPDRPSVQVPRRRPGTLGSAQGVYAPVRSFRIPASPFHPDMEDRMQSWRRAALLVVAICSVAWPVAANGDSEAKLLPGLGDYSHPIRTSSAEAQTFFDQGLALLYNFNHAEAEKSFLRAAA